MQLNRASYHVNTTLLAFKDCSFKNAVFLPCDQEGTCKQRLLCPRFQFLPQPQREYIHIFNLLTLYTLTSVKVGTLRYWLGEFV